MPSAMDSTFLTLLLKPDSNPPIDPNTNKPVTHCKARIEGLVDTLSERRDRLIVPAPSLGELLCIADSPHNLITLLSSYACIDIAAYDGKAAWEFGEIIRSVLKSGKKLEGEDGKWPYTRIDRMIVAIAKAHGADTFYSDDRRQRNFATDAGLRVVHLWEVDVSSARAQQHMSERSAPWPEQRKPARGSNLKKPPGS